MDLLKYLILFVLALGIPLTAAVGCDGWSGEDDDDDDDDDDEEEELLGPGHEGWKDPDCGACHSLPAEDHSETEPAECAACHGGNGACDPNGSAVPDPHAETDDCVTCHGANHTFTDNADCAACHFAATGVVDCAM